jgi:WD40 repeat protein
VWDAKTGKEVFKLQWTLNRTGSRVGMIVPPRTHYFVGVWDLTQARRLARIRIQGTSFYNVLAFTPDGKRLVTGSGDERLQFWDPATGDPVGEIEVPRVVRRVTFTPDGKLMAVTFFDPTILVYVVEKAMKPAKEP